MENKAKLESINSKIKSNQKISRVTTVLFVFCSLIVLLYQFVLTKYAAYNNFIYKLGELAYVLSMSIVTSYIFYCLTSLVPRKIEQKNMKPIICDIFKAMGANIYNLMEILTGEETWFEMDSSLLKEKTIEKNKDRKIWIEESNSIYSTADGIQILNPKVLLLMHDYVENIEMLIKDIIDNSSYLADSNIVRRLIWYSQSYCMKRIKMCTNAALEQEKLDLTSDKYATGTTYLDNVITEELPLRMFENDRRDNKIFIDEIKKLYQEINKFV